MMDSQPAPTRKIQHITLPIYNLSFGGGGSLMVERVLAHTPGVVGVSVNSVTEMAYICYDMEQSNPEQLAAVIKRAKFGPRG